MDINQEIILSKLPIDIQNRIPYSLRTKKDTYKLSSLPFNIQYFITKYLDKQKTVEYDVVFDTLPYQSKLEDFEIINNLYDLVVEYIKNYFLISKGTYPFEPMFYSKLRYYIQTKDTSTQYTLVNNEVNRIVGVVSSDLNIPVSVKNLKIDKSSLTNTDIVYNIMIEIEVNNTPKNIQLFI